MPYGRYATFPEPCRAGAPSSHPEVSPLPSSPPSAPPLSEEPPPVPPPPVPPPCVGGLLGTVGRDGTDGAVCAGPPPVPPPLPVLAEDDPGRDCVALGTLDAAPGADGEEDGEDEGPPERPAEGVVEGREDFSPGTSGSGEPSRSLVGRSVGAGSWDRGLVDRTAVPSVAPTTSDIPTSTVASTAPRRSTRRRSSASGARGPSLRQASLARRPSAE